VDEGDHAFRSALNNSLIGHSERHLQTANDRMRYRLPWRFRSEISRELATASAQDLPQSACGEPVYQRRIRAGLHWARAARPALRLLGRRDGAGGGRGGLAWGLRARWGPGARCHRARCAARRHHGAMPHTPGAQDGTQAIDVQAPRLGPGAGGHDPGMPGFPGIQAGAQGVQQPHGRRQERGEPDHCAGALAEGAAGRRTS
jgi:hypothetical protein